ncbi:MAG: Hsp20/alpha crystallin family protein [bacterium]|nr:Hsp20/alpha crystallin family protein [bacterium]
MKNTLQKFSPMNDLFDLRKEIDSMFDNRFFGGMLQRFGEQAWAPVMDIVESDKDFTVKVELPGMKKEEIKINIENNILSIEGERKSESEEKGKTFHRIERSYGSFYRAVSLPKQIDEQKIKASFNDGLLTVVLPKSDIAKTKAIEITDK